MGRGSSQASAVGAYYPFATDPSAMQHTVRPIPALDTLYLPAEMTLDLKLEVGRVLTALKNEMDNPFHEEDSPLGDQYGEFTKEQQKEWRRRQNREAARRFRLKRMEMVWGLVSGIQDLNEANQKLREMLSRKGLKNGKQVKTECK